MQRERPSRKVFRLSNAGTRAHRGTFPYVIQTRTWRNRRRSLTNWFESTVRPQMKGGEIHLRSKELDLVTSPSYLVAPHFKFRTLAFKPSKGFLFRSCVFHFVHFGRRENGIGSKGGGYNMSSGLVAEMTLTARDLGAFSNASLPT